MNYRVVRLVLCVLLGSSSAWAALGEVVALRQQARVQDGGFSVRTTESGSSTVREYVTAGGIVFGLAWNGLTHPDLGKLLGGYATDYQMGVRQSPRVFGRRSHIVNTGRVVVEKWGHMRSQKGRAYDPALLPQGVRADEIK